MLEYLLYLNLHSHIFYSRMHGDAGTMQVAFMLAGKDQIFNQVCFFRHPSNHCSPAACVLEMSGLSSCRLPRQASRVAVSLQVSLRAEVLQTCLSPGVLAIQKALKAAGAADSVGATDGPCRCNRAAAGATASSSQTLCTTNHLLSARSWLPLETCLWCLQHDPANTLRGRRYIKLQVDSPCLCVPLASAQPGGVSGPNIEHNILCGQHNVCAPVCAPLHREDGSCRRSPLISCLWCGCRSLVRRCTLWWLRCSRTLTACLPSYTGSRPAPNMTPPAPISSELLT